MESVKLKEYQDKLICSLKLEFQSQQKSVEESYVSFAALKELGYGIYPLRIKNRSYGIAEYPEITFIPPSGQSIDKLRQQSQTELFSQDGEVVKANLIYINEEEGKIQLLQDDFPEWLEVQKIGIRVGADEKSNQIAIKSVNELTFDNPFVKFLFTEHLELRNNTEFIFNPSDRLNLSQNEAVKNILGNSMLSVLHGPPGTGKTTTLVEAICQLVAQGEKVIAVAPSNMAVDHLAISLIKKGVNVLRIGNTAKISEELSQHTIEGRLSKGAVFQELKKMKIQAQEFRRMASQYKRNFGKEEREQRNLIWNHFRELKKEIFKTVHFYKEKWKAEAQVICGTPVGLSSEVKDKDYSTLVLDEAGQCLQPFAWIVMQPHFQKIVLAGDPFQLPPTVISNEAEKMGLSVSILDKILEKQSAILLDTQYRMSSQIVGFSNEYFYHGQLQTPIGRCYETSSILFYDTAGTGYEEEKGEDGTSLTNSGELEIVSKIINTLNLEKEQIAFISPYSGQVSKAIAEQLAVSKFSTIDSFQGQEFPIVILSLVRSNTNNNIGFLKDYRRINVAMTRAQKQLIIVGDSATIGQDEFYKKLLEYIDKEQAYHTAWELMY